LQTAVKCKGHVIDKRLAPIIREQIEEEGYEIKENCVRSKPSSPPQKSNEKRPNEAEPFFQTSKKAGKKLSPQTKRTQTPREGKVQKIRKKEKKEKLLTTSQLKPLSVRDSFRVLSLGFGGVR
jgi:hypothetical protein